MLAMGGCAVLDRPNSADACAAGVIGLVLGQARTGMLDTETEVLARGIPPGWHCARPAAPQDPGCCVTVRFADDGEEAWLARDPTTPSVAVGHLKLQDCENQREQVNRRGKASQPCERVHFKR